MKKILVLFTVLGLLATPAMAKGTHLEKNTVHHKQAAKHATKHQKKQQARRQNKKAQRKLAKHKARKHKIAV
jgi:hypothetical protein